MYIAIQIVVLVVGAMFIIKGILNIAKGYHIDKLLSICIKKELPKTNEEKGK